MKDILQEIVSHKKIEVAALYQKYDLELLKEEAIRSTKSFYTSLEKAKKANSYFFITEFKRRSPSKGAINESINIEIQINSYLEIRANAVSVLTDEKFFGGTYNDLETASKILKDTDVLLLQKDFIIDPIQIYLARKAGVNLILLIAAILGKEQLENLKSVAASLNMGALVEVHDLEEYEKIKDLNCEVIGVNNRDLKNFKLSLNRCNYIAQHITGEPFIIAESGVENEMDFEIVKQNADGFLIGTSLMQKAKQTKLKKAFSTSKKYFFKACGIRSHEFLNENIADLIGINFSRLSKRKIDESILSENNIPQNTVAVFKGNNEEEITNTLKKYPFKYVQLYGDEVSVEFVKQTKQKILLAYPIKEASDFEKLEVFAPYIDLFILDGATPGSGNEINIEIPKDFKYPFLLAGGINKNNLDKITEFERCIGVDIASGIETEGKFDIEKINRIKEKFNGIKLPSFSN